MSVGDGQQLIVFMRNSGQPSAIQALSEDLNKRPGAVRLCVVETLLTGEYRHVLTGGQLDPIANVDQPRLEQLYSAVEELLAHELLDTEERMGTPRAEEDKLENPRICEATCAGLGLLWPQRYKFKTSNSMFEPDTQRIRSHNIWLRSVGTPPLPPPVRPTVGPPLN